MCQCLCVWAGILSLYLRVCVYVYVDFRNVIAFVFVLACGCGPRALSLYVGGWAGPEVSLVLIHACSFSFLGSLWAVSPEQYLFLSGPARTHKQRESSGPVHAHAQTQSERLL